MHTVTTPRRLAARTPVFPLDLRPACLLAAALAAAFPGTQACAADIPVVTVSAARGSALDRLDLAVTELDRDQVQAAPQTDVEQILNKLPGVFARQEPSAMIHPTGQVFSIRGFGNATNVNTLVMVDGIPINDPFFRTIDWGQVPKDSVERIEVVRGGGAAALWGNLAMGGVVNIVTRRPLAGERRFDVSIGSRRTHSADAAATLVAAPTFSLGLNGGWRASDGYHLTPAEFRSRYMDRTGSRVQNLTLSADFAPSQQHHAYLKLGAHRTEAQGLLWSMMRSEWDKYQASAGGSHRFDGAAVHWNAWAGRGEMETENASSTPSFSILDPAVGTPYLAQAEQARYRTEGASLFAQADAGSWKEVRVGIDLRRIRAQDHIAVFGPQVQRAALLNAGEHRFAGLFAQGSWRPSDMPLDLTLGLREDFFQTRDGSLSGNVDGRPTGGPLADQWFRHFSPRAGAKYYFANGYTARAAVYRNFAAPGMNQMYRSFVGGSSYTGANPDLVPQTNRGAEIGLDYRASGLNLALTAFHNRLRDYIDYAPLCTGVAACNPLLPGTGLASGSIASLYRYVNAGDAVLQGLELIADWQITRSLELHGGLTRTRAYLRHSRFGTIPSVEAPAVPAGVQLGQVPRWVANAGLRWQGTPDLQLSLDVKAFPDFWYNTAHTTMNTGAVILDAGFVYRLRPAVEIYGSVLNLGSRSYYDQGLGYTTMNGNTLNPYTVPQRGQPLHATLGLRTSF